jgi:hypothetical protein
LPARPTAGGRPCGASGGAASACRQLLAQGQVLKGELAMAAEEEREEPEQVEQKSDHRAEIVAGSEPTDQPLAGRTRYWRRTASYEVHAADGASLRQRDARRPVSSAKHPKVAKVMCTGLATRPQHLLVAKQMSQRYDGMVTAVLKGGLPASSASRALQALHAHREPRRRREPDRASGDHDARLAARGRAQGSWH